MSFGLGAEIHVLSDSHCIVGISVEKLHVLCTFMVTEFGLHNDLHFRFVNQQTYVNTPSMVYNGHLKFQTSVSLRIPLYGSRNLAYLACKMDYMCPL